jgi:RluA family pseudouridine synthase
LNAFVAVGTGSEVFRRQAGALGDSGEHSWADLFAIVVVNKPAPLPMHACGRFNRNTLTWILGKVYQGVRLASVHRLDANTSGVVLFAKTGGFAAGLHQQFQRGDITKTYLVRAAGEPETEEFVSEVAIGSEPGPAGARLPDPDGQVARSTFRVIERGGDGTCVLEARTETGRTNQIRIHLWDLGMPVVGDPQYLPNGMLGHTQTLPPNGPPMCLHARSIAFQHPVTKRDVVFEAPDPDWTTA